MANEDPNGFNKQQINKNSSAPSAPSAPPSAPSAPPSKILTPLEQAIQSRKNKAAARAAARGNAISNALRSSANTSENVSNKTLEILAERNVRNAKKELRKATPGFFKKVGRKLSSGLGATSRALNPKRAFGSNEYMDKKLLENEQRRKSKNTRNAVEKARINAAKAYTIKSKKNLNKIKNPQKYPSPDLIAEVESAVVPSAPPPDQSSNYQAQQQQQQQQQQQWQQPQFQTPQQLQPQFQFQQLQPQQQPQQSQKSLLTQFGSIAQQGINKAKQYASSSLQNPQALSETIHQNNQNTQINNNMLMELLQKQHKMYELLEQLVNKTHKKGGKKTKTRKNRR